MTILGLDSSTEVCSAALVQDGMVIAERINLCDSNHAALLPTYVQELQAEAQNRGLTIGGIALSEGPGSYTGLRIGASLAKGLCYGLDIPLYAIPTLSIIAYNGLADERVSGLICPMIDARRMEVYCALYPVSELGVSGLAEAKVIDEHSFEDLLREHVIYFCGNGAEKCKAVIKHENARWIDGIVPTGAAAGKLVEVSIQKSEVRYQKSDIRNQISVISGKDIAYFEPNYLKEFIAAPSHVKGLH